MAVTLEHLATAGVGRFRDPLSCAIDGNAVVFSGGNQSGKSTLLDLTASLLDPAPDAARAGRLRSLPGVEPSSASLRLRDARGEFQIHWDLIEERFSLVTGSETATEPSAIRARLGLAGPGIINRLFVCSAERLALLCAGAARADARAWVDSGALARSVAALRGEIGLLRSQLSEVANWERARERVVSSRRTDRRRLSALEERERLSREARWRRWALEEELERVDGLVGEQSDLEERSAEYVRLERERTQGIHDLSERAAALEAEQAQVRSPRLARWGGIASAALLLANFGLGSPLGIGVPSLLATLLALCGGFEFRTLLRHRKLVQELSEARDRIRLIRNRFELQTAELRKLAEGLGLKHPAELPAARERYLELQGRCERERNVELTLGDPESLAGEVQEIRDRVVALHDPEDGGAARQSAENLCVRLDMAENELRTLERVGEAHLRGSQPEASGRGGPVALTFEDLLIAGSALLAIPVDELWAKVETGTSAYLRLFSNRDYACLRRRTRGDFVLQQEARRSEIPVDDLTGTALHVAYCALQFALVELSAGRHALPLMLDDPFASFDAQRVRAAARAVRRLSARTQVLLATSDPTFEAVADQVIRLDGL